jgi:hypothetical protein
VQWIPCSSIRPSLALLSVSWNPHHLHMETHVASKGFNLQPAKHSLSLHMEAHAGSSESILFNSISTRSPVRSSAPSKSYLIDLEAWALRDAGLTSASAREINWMALLKGLPRINELPGFLAAHEGCIEATDRSSKLVSLAQDLGTVDGPSARHTSTSGTLPGLTAGDQGAAPSRDVIFKPSTWDQIPFGVVRALISGCYCTPAGQYILEDRTRKTCASCHSLWLTNDNPTKIYTTFQQPSTEPLKPVQCQHLQRKRFRSPSATMFLLIPIPFDFFHCFCDAGAACED